MRLFQCSTLTFKFGKKRRKVKEILWLWDCSSVPPWPFHPGNLKRSLHRREGRKQNPSPFSFDFEWILQIFWAPSLICGFLIKKNVDTISEWALIRGTWDLSWRPETNKWVELWQFHQLKKKTEIDCWAINTPVQCPKEKWALGIPFLLVLGTNTVWWSTLKKIFNMAHSLQNVEYIEYTKYIDF